MILCIRVTRYQDSHHVITDVLIRRKNQLLSSVFLVLILMIAASIIMYGIEHEAQPEVFKNAFSGFWWANSTLLTVGYGDIYPVTSLGKVIGIINASMAVLSFCFISIGKVGSEGNVIVTLHGNLSSMILHTSSMY